METFRAGHGQEALWLLEGLGATGGAYREAFLVEARGPLDPVALRDAVWSFVERHATCRSTFVEEEGEVRVVVRPFEPALYDPGLWPCDEDALEETVRAFSYAPYDLREPPLMRFRLLRLRPDLHVLLVAGHHAAFDGTSHAVFMRELWADYAARAKGEAPVHPNTRATYRTHAEAQRAKEGSPAWEAAARYWRDALPPALEPLTLPIRPDPAPSGPHRCGSLVLDLDPALYAGLERLAASQGTSVFVAVVAGLSALLHRYGNDGCVPVTAAADLHALDTLHVTGFFTNDVPLLTKPAPDVTFHAFLGHVRDVTTDAMRHRDFPFQEVVKIARPERGLRVNPLFQVILSYIKLPRLRQPPGLQVSSDFFTSPDAKTDLLFQVLDSGTGIRLRLEYDAELFDAPTIDRMAAHLLSLLRAACAAPGTPLGGLPILSDAEREHLVHGLNRTASPYPRDACIHQLFREQAARAPAAVALVHPRGETTYGELDARSDRLARHLRLLGVGPGTPVGLCLERGPDLVVATLGILKAGGAYVPLDPAYPAERLAAMLRDVAAPVLVTEAALAAALPHAGATRLLIDADWPEVACEPALPLPESAGPESLAYVMFTSGSTGGPKGVAVPHRAVVRLVRGADYLDVGPEDAYLQSAPFSFDAATLEVWAPLLNGARLVLPPPGPLALDELAAALRAHQVTTLWLTAPLFHAMVDHDVSALRGVRTLLAGGDALSPPHVRRALDALPGTRLVNGYGPTENTTFSACHAIRPADALRASIPIGRPIANSRALVLDPRGEPAPVGVPGELFVGGDGLALGYWARPDLTAERFVPDPFLPGARLYRTGDRARWLPEGELEFLGRLDQQVKVRGHRIEPGEVEAALARHPSVRESVVVAREDAAGQKRLVAYVVHEGAAPSASGLRDFLKGLLPDPMVPTAYVPLPRLPLTPNGKVDRKALPAPGPAEEGARHVEPRTPEEHVLAEVWREVLRVPRVGVEDNFFDLGGDSILSLQVVARAARRGVRVTHRDLFRAQTIARLAPLATAGAASGDAEQGVVSGDAPPTPIQRWFLDAAPPRPHWFHQHVLLRAPADADPARVGEALGSLLAHHDALRLRFARDASGWRQEFAPTAPPPAVPLVDLTTLPPDARDAALRRELERIAAACDLAQGPLLGAALLDLAPGDRRLLLAAHHLAVDAVSWSVLVEDLETAYAQRLRGEPARLPPKTTSFRAWAHRLRAHASSDALRKELDHWLRLARAPAAPLPRDHHGGPTTVASEDAVRILLDAEQTRALHEAPRAYRGRVDDLLLCALGLALHGWTGGRAHRVDVEGHGRESPFEGVDLSRTVGWFTLLRPVLLEVDDLKDLDRALKSVKESLRAAPHGGLGHGLLRHLSAEGAILAQAPPSEVGFNHLGRLDGAESPGGLFAGGLATGGLSQAPEAPRPHLLEVVSGVADGRLVVTFAYSRDAHARATVEALAARFADALRALVAHCRAPGAGGATPSDFPLSKLPQSKLDLVMRKVVRRNEP